MLRIRGVQAVPEEGHRKGRRLRQSHVDRESRAALQKGRSHLVGPPEEALQEDPVKDPQHGQRQAEESDAGVRRGGGPGVGEALAQEPGRWYCGRGHSFDVARQGYVNLLPVSQKHSRQPGDTREQVAARKAFLDGGTYAPVAEALTRFAAAERPGAMLDIGCGEGYYLTQVQAALPELEAWGVDISKDAVRYAAVRNKRARFLTATASHLPFADRQFDVVSSLFALTLPEEFRRVLRPGGAFIQVMAGDDHLVALRSLIY